MNWQLVIICNLFFCDLFFEKYFSMFQYVYFPSRSSNPYKAQKKRERKSS